LQQELPGLKGFSSQNIKKMRVFVNAWKNVFNYNEIGSLPVLNDADVQVSVPGMLNYYTAAGIDDVVSFYKNQLPAAGWTFDDDLDMVVDGSAILTFYQGNAQLSVLINREDDGRVNVTLMMESN